MKYKDINQYKPFRIMKPKRDDTVWKVGEYGLEIFFHAEKFWCNPPTDSNMEWHAIKAIEKYGIRYIPENYAEKFISLPHDEAWKYAEQIGKDYSAPPPPAKPGRKTE